MPSSLLMVVVFSCTLFFSAALLFLLEPLVGKLMLPLLGGTPAVWNTCMVFFQAVLLAGYAYAHAAGHLLSARRSAVLHLVLLALPVPLLLLVFLPGTILTRLIAGSEGSPILALLLALTVVVGLPMLVVCSSAPLLSKWFSSTNHPSGKDPYFLYGASNVGSMLALLAYPTLVEPYFSLADQRLYWSIGFGLLLALTGLCALLLWRSQPALELAPAEPVVPPQPSQGLFQAERPGPSSAITTEKPAPASLESTPDPEAPVTLLRWLKWIASAFVPSSLMIGATAYMTIDLSPIPLLWMLPLALYLLSFVIVFARIPAIGQALIVSLLSIGFLGAFGWWLVPLVVKEPATVLLLFVRIACAGVWCLLTVGLLVRAVRADDRTLIHRSMVVVMPLLVLTLAFMMLAEIHPSLLANIAFHLVVLFVVCMVCHGELARDRPAPYLTGYFLSMSFGGVVGGLFNGLIAPLTFDTTAEYPLALGACLLLPPLFTWPSGPRWSQVRPGLTVLGIVFAFGLAFAGQRLFAWYLLDLPPTQPALDVGQGPWAWSLVALIAGLILALLGCSWVAMFAPTRTERFLRIVNRSLDFVLPVAFATLTFGLFWGLQPTTIATEKMIERAANLFGVGLYRARNILTFGLPVGLCLFLVNRPLRLGLSLGAVLLAGAYCVRLYDPALFQARSFFGVLRVEGQGLPTDPHYNLRLVHGSTMHGTQFPNDPELRYQALSYYHRTGPVGLTFARYNVPDKSGNLPPFGVVGLGTGTMATYGIGESLTPGQKVTFFDIDPLVVKLSGPGGRYFTYVEDAIKRGVQVNVVLGDARLTLARLRPAEEDKFGLLVIDAFSSDAIPVHLITEEALLMYFEKMQERGIVCFHISNRYLDLQPVLANLVAKHGLAAYQMSDDEEDGPGMIGKSRSHWVMIARRKEYLRKLLEVPQWEEVRPDERVGVWTDDYSNLLSVFLPYQRWLKTLRPGAGKSTGSGDED